MTGHSVVPIDELTPRLPRAGAIRLGEKVAMAGGRTRPAARSSFRFTSADEHALGQLAAVYGGRIEPWLDPRIADRQWQLATDAVEIDVILPPDPVTRSYELWSGSGCIRRCDGRAAFVHADTDSHEGEVTSCVCTAEGSTECALMTRLELLVPCVRLAGVWTLRTSSVFAALELPAMVDLARNVAGPGFISAKLRMAQRRLVSNGETRRFVVPTIALPDTLAEITGRRELAARSTTAALAAGPDRQLPQRGAPEPELGAGRALPARPSPPPPTARMRHLFKVLARAGVADDDRHDWAAGWLGRPVTTFTDLSDDDVLALIAQAEAEAGDDDVPQPTIVPDPSDTQRTDSRRVCAVCAGSLAGHAVARTPDGWAHRSCPDQRGSS